MIAISKTLQHSVNLLCLFGKFHLHQQLANGHVKGVSKEGKASHIASQYRKKKGIVRLAQVASNDAFVNVICFNPFQIMAGGFTFFSFG